MQPDGHHIDFSNKAHGHKIEFYDYGQEPKNRMKMCDQCGEVYDGYMKTFWYETQKQNAKKQSRLAPIHTLYICYNQQGEMLYVGISLDAGRRLKQHARDKDWFCEVSTIDVRHFDTRQMLEYAEKQMIQTNSPKYNKALLPK